MTDKKNMDTSCAAFPASTSYGPNGEWSPPYNVGMTLRDYFAAAALQGFLAGNPDADCGFEGYAHDAYKTADAVLKKRGENE